MNSSQTQIQEKITSPQNTFTQTTGLVDHVFRWSVKNRGTIILVFKLYYFVNVVLLLLGGHASYYLTEKFLFFNSLGLWAGKIGLVFYVLTVIPGIARRFGVKHKVVALLMIFRRYTGISMFLGVFLHFVILRGAFYARQMRIDWPMPTFELFGLIALIFTLLLFLTSNDYAVFHLRKLWNKIHQLTYIIIWLIAFHVLLQRISIWSVIISITVVLQVASYIYSRLLKISLRSANLPK